MTDHPIPEKGDIQAPKPPMLQSTKISILIYVDKILETYALILDHKNPTPINSDDITVTITPIHNAPEALQAETGSNDLHLRVPVGKLLALREIPISNKGHNFPLLYGFGRDHDHSPLISTPHPIVERKRALAVPDEDDVSRIRVASSDRFGWRSHVLRTGQAPYPIRFMMIDKTGQTLGYFQWTPTLTITG